MFDKKQFVLVSPNKRFVSVKKCLALVIKWLVSAKTCFVLVKKWLVSVKSDLCL